MNKQKIIAIGILPLMWLLYFGFELISGRINSTFDIIMNLLLTLFFAISGAFIYYIGTKSASGAKSKTMFKLFIVLMLLDQGLKLVINTWYFNKNFYIIPKFISFSPIINSQGSWLNARFSAGVSFTALIVLNIIAIFLFIEGYRYYIFNNHKDFWSDMCFIFIISGCLCSLIDKIFYGGSLDFIGIGSLFIADFKDIYINLAILFFVLTISFNGYFKNDQETSLKDDIESLTKFLNFIKCDITKKGK
ncbi:signal peptidase II [Clostridium cavendishii DSM 21758]|uniref:Signal peptidase II n=1 Tax=Clostridium cavendishii DSM 21758 TaxID=1121302 RepID=A0A1M6VMH4_9CLOT|nr:signal peptidase II [Clostridium cavendishii]SHK82757.1 signal peptidase II [Clostridium cavendishii DSM 21758]